MTLRKYIYVLLTLVLWASTAQALHVQPVGTPDQDYMFIDNGGDTIYIFNGDIEMRHPAGNTDWYTAANDLLYQSNTNILYAPEDGGYYTVAPTLPIGSWT